MSGPRRKIGCVIVAHGNVAECLMDAVQGILGTQSHWFAVSNRGLSLKDLSVAVDRSVAKLRKDCDVVVMSDMPGGSCHHACQEMVAGDEEVRFVSGVNLMMLLEFFVKRDRQELPDLLDLLLERGRDAIRIF